MRCPAPLLVLVLGLSVACGGPEPPTDVILITVDTLRQGQLHYNGYARPTSPALDALAEETIRFDGAHAHAASTGPALSSLMTGLYPIETAVMWNGHRLPDELSTLAEVLDGAGFHTMGVVSNAILKRGSGFEQGFDVFDDDFTRTELNRPFPERGARDTTRAALSLWATAPEGPRFLWVHYQDPHGPYTPARVPWSDPPPDLQAPQELPLGTDDLGRGSIPRYQRRDNLTDPRSYVNLYDGEVRATDEAIGQLLTQLRADAPRWERALVVFTADHGEALGEHDFWFVHGHAVYEEIIHVPLLLKLPGGAPGIRTDLVGHADLLPTVLGVLGLPGPERGRGRDLREEGDRVLFSFTGPDESPDPNMCLIRSGWKLIRFANREELVRVGVAAASPSFEVKGELAQALDDVAKNPLTRLKPQKRELNRELEEELRRLGYLD